MKAIHGDDLAFRHCIAARTRPSNLRGQHGLCIGE
jgi:hypothetical protein